MSAYRVEKLTGGSERGIFHSHAYYDIPVFDSASRLVAGHRVCFEGRHPTRDDEVEIGCIDLEGDRRWQAVGTSRAWSWQQGAMSQWLPDSRRLVWNDREGDRFVARVRDLDSGTTVSLPRPVYAVDPLGRFALSLNMARLNAVRPGYGYPDGAGDFLDEMHPRTDGVWRIDLSSGESRLILPLDEAVDFLFSQIGLGGRLKHRLGRYIYWFNHAKISPDGRRFTVKLRFRHRGLRRGWNDSMGVSLTCGVDGSDLHLLARGTSHVMWLDERILYLWNRRLSLYEDCAPKGKAVGLIAPDRIRHNVHIRHFPDDPQRFVYDKPYRERIALIEYDSRSDRHETIARFDNHRPANGPFRCDLHPVPSPDGRKILVTSLQDGGRQIYLLSR